MRLPLRQSLLARLVRSLLLLGVLGLGPLPAWAGTTVWGADYFPNVTLINQDGKPCLLYTSPSPRD